MSPELSFTDFENKIEEIIPNIDSDKKAAIKKRIEVEIETLVENPKIYKQFIKVRERIRAIEIKALKRLRNAKVPLLSTGSVCTLCSGYESDVKIMINISSEHNICNKCILLIKDIIDENTKK